MTRYQKADFALEIIRHINTTVIMAQLQAGGDAGGETSEVLFHRLPDWFQRFEAGGLLHRMNTHAIGGTVIDGGEDRYGAILLSECRCGIRAPHLIRRLREDGAVMRITLRRLGHAHGREQLIFTQQTQDAFFRGAYSGKAQPSPDFPITFS